MEALLLDMLRYYRNCIVDGERNSLDTSELKYDFATDIHEMKSGCINPELASMLFEDAFNKPFDQICEKNVSLNVLLCPLVFNRNASHEQDITSIQSKAIPAILSARLKPDGKLLVPEESYPWIPRSYLEPTLSSIVLGSLDELDAYLSKHKKPPSDSKWENYWSYCENMLHSVIAQMVVDAAVKQEESPPIIVAASNNNQAVTNIIDSLQKVSGDDLLAKRWIPEIISYGMYLLSSYKQGKMSNEDAMRYQTLDPDSLGFPQKVENERNVEA